jgi:anti-sigma-K factor RskA
VPEGYFTTFKKDMLAAERQKSGIEWRRLGAGIAVAASLALLVTAGLQTSRREDPQEMIDSIDLMVFSDMSTESYYDLVAIYDEEDLTEEDIIEYLINSETSLENIASYE